jgi:hypothetical protein
MAHLLSGWLGVGVGLYVVQCELQGCALKYLSWTDVLLLTDGTSLIFFFLFMRGEYYRSREACLPEHFDKIRRNMNNHRRF